MTEPEPMLFGAEHVRQYEESDGEVGFLRHGAPILILTITGRKTGRPRKVPLIFQEHEGRYVVVASNGGAADHPDWYTDLQADPEVRVQVKADRFAARARTATGEEREKLWRTMAAVFAIYDEYRRTTEREIPVVVLEPVEPVEPQP